MKNVNVRQMNKIIYHLKYAYPVLLCLFLIICNFATVSFNPYNRVPIPFILSVIFYFSIFYPSVLNVVIVFCLGLLSDLLIGPIIGIHTFIFVLLFFVANLNRRYIISLKFNDYLKSYALILGGVYIVWYMVGCLAVQSFLPLMPILFQYIILVCSYPLFAKVCTKIHMKLGSSL